MESMAKVAKSTAGAVLIKRALVVYLDMVGGEERRSSNGASCERKSSSTTNFVPMHFWKMTRAVWGRLKFNPECLQFLLLSVFTSC